MLASELVNKLNDAIKEHGDIQVEIDDAEWGACEVIDVVLDKDRRLFNTRLYAEGRRIIGKSVDGGETIYEGVEEFPIILIK